VTPSGGTGYPYAMTSATKWVWYPFGATWRFLRDNGKRIGVTIAGGVLVLAGLVMLVLPGPGVLVVIAGLAILATEYVWAQRALNFAKRKAGDTKDKAKGLFKRS
jgi:Putative transmembrane protein (PGPGW)